MLDTLPFDALLLIAVRLPHPCLERALQCSRELARVLRDDCFFAAVAFRRWGAAFWREALGRPTIRHAFLSMREELRAVHRFESSLAARGLPAWTHADYRMWWRLEAAHARRVAHAPVEPKPPAPRAVACKSSPLATSTTSGVSMRSSTSCATRSPAFTSNTSSP